MTPDLRDWFAAHVAAALAAEQRLGLETIAARAYDVADALLAERAQRMDAELSDLREPGADEDDGYAMPALLDDAPPMEEERDDDEDDVRPAWMPSDRPGLARTQLE